MEQQQQLPLLQQQQKHLAINNQIIGNHDPEECDEEEIITRKKYTTVLIGTLYALFHFFCIGLIIFYTVNSLAKPYTDLIAMSHYSNSHVHVQATIAVHPESHPVRDDGRTSSSSQVMTMTYYFDWNDYTSLRFHSVLFSTIQRQQQQQDDTDVDSFQIIQLSKAPQIISDNSANIFYSGNITMVVDSDDDSNSDDNGQFYVESFHMNPGSTALLKSQLSLMNSKYSHLVSCAIIVGDANYRLWRKHPTNSLYLFKNVNVQQSGSHIEWRLLFGDTKSYPHFPANVPLGDDNSIRVPISRSSMIYIVYYAPLSTGSKGGEMIANGTFEYVLNTTQYEIPSLSNVVSTCIVSNVSTCQVPAKNNILIVSNYTSDEPIVNSELQFQYQVSYPKVWLWTGVLIFILLCFDIVLISWKITQVLQRKSRGSSMDDYGNISQQ